MFTELKGKITGNLSFTWPLIDGLKELLFFNKLCTHPDNTTSDEYFNEIAYNIDLTSKIRVVLILFQNRAL